MIDLGRETDGNNEFCLGAVCVFSLCIKALRLIRNEHGQVPGTVVTHFNIFFIQC